MSNKFYLTTTLPYVNALPHIGHTSEFIKADVITRYKRSVLGKENVWFNVGTDEHGLKNYQKARDLGKEPREYVDELAAGWKEFCELYRINYDTFYRTSASYHVKPAQEFWKRSVAKGDVYKKEYKGWYCVGCEEFKTEKEIIESDEKGENGKCAIHKKDLVWTEEENYFFRLSKYRDELLKWIEENPDVLKPAKAKTELVNWLSEMEDISISRSKENLGWGIDVPGDDTQVMYVWFDALTNYVNVLGFGQEFPPKEAFKNEEDWRLKTQNSKLEDWWPGVQIFGVDNLRFQCAIWQGILLTADLPQTKKLLRNGFILASDGTKMSKTVGNTVSPFDQEEKYGAEAVRFYLVAGIPTYSDSPYKEDDLVNIYNSHLANNFGNLLNRVIHLANTKEVKLNDEDLVENDFKEKILGYESRLKGLYEEYDLQEAANLVNELATFGNEYITENEPWAKDKTNEEIELTLNNLSYLLKTVIELYAPIIPDSCERAAKMLEKREKGVLFEKKEVGK
ncbi:MAG: methionine--tRNA ligase [Candidatus Dojkabacteria bacterium]|nr:methionine--tRNA ligase [Candidatus Dojkabacteria bacterium]MDQ7021155.1 methionine--tRNA ligase [Candidatus Dojkabacteria bacterium]